MPQAGTVDKPHRLPLVAMPLNRGSTPDKDGRLVNCYVEKNEMGDHWIYKRAGLLADTALSGAGQGTFNWNGDIYAIFGASLYKNGVSVGTVDATGGKYHFSSCLGGIPKLQLGNGVKAYNYDISGGLVQIIDANFPAPFVKGFTYLDGTTYVMDSSAAIHGSNLNDPTTYDPLNLILAQIEPDKGVGISKQLVYLVALKQWSTEMFYDAGNPAGSPLGPVQGAKANYGCVSIDTLQDIDGALFWVSTNKSGSAQIVILSAQKASAISTKAVEKLLDGADFSTAMSWQYKADGHSFYVVTIKSLNLTLSYDVAEHLWCQWTDTNGNYMPIIDFVVRDNMDFLVQHESNGKLYKMSSAYTSDDDALFSVDIYTPNFDGEVDRRKHLNVMRINADQQVGSTLQVRKNDDDYDPAKWSNFRSVDLSNQRPFLTGCGTFYRRAHHFHHRSDTKLRIKSIDLQLDMGVL
jgi:hypothetical protein